MSVELQEFDSYNRFKNIVPKNPRDWYGSVVMYSTVNGTFFNISFGSGDNLDASDIDQGFNDYIMVEQYRTDGTCDLADVMDRIKHDGRVDEYTEGVEEVDGGQWLLKHRDWRSGDIRRFIMEAMDFAGYGLPEGTSRDVFHMDAVYICADYDNLGEIEHEEGA